MKVKPANAGASVKASGGKKMSTVAKARGAKKPAMARGGMMKAMGDKDKPAMARGGMMKDKEKPAMARGGMPKKFSRKK